MSHNQVENILLERAILELGARFRQDYPDSKILFQLGQPDLTFFVTPEGKLSFEIKKFSNNGNDPEADTVSSDYKADYLNLWQPGESILECWERLHKEEYSGLQCYYNKS